MRYSDVHEKFCILVIASFGLTLFCVPLGLLDRIKDILERTI